MFVLRLVVSKPIISTAKCTIILIKIRHIYFLHHRTFEKPVSEDRRRVAGHKSADDVIVVAKNMLSTSSAGVTSESEESAVPVLEGQEKDIQVKGD